MTTLKVEFFPGMDPFMATNLVIVLEKLDEQRTLSRLSPGASNMRRLGITFSDLPVCGLG